jgi:opacity protein-like surface antigen
MRLIIIIMCFALITSGVCSPAKAESSKDNNFFIELNGGCYNSYKPKGDFYQGTMGRNKIYGVEAGYKFNKNFRMSLGVDFIENFRNRYSEVETVKNIRGGDFKVPYDNVTKVSSIPVMANFYYDIVQINNFVPYLTIGSGINFSKTSFRREPDPSDNDPAPEEYARGVNKDFAYRLGLGVQYLLNNNLNLDLRYQYVDLGRFKTGRSSSIEGEVDRVVARSGKLKYNQFLLGFIFKF